ncbi:hypothetical protein F5883DRAFT_548704 [Diaporthe sp. PMI_573]|nr:hypothetical protein F5883DRAFT_548704 [Diaporthaceae sp. PMI_573]
MTFAVFTNSAQGATFVLCIVGIPITILVTVFRFIGTRRARRKVNLEDWFALVALISFLVHSSTALWTVATLNGKDLFAPGQLPPSQVIRTRKVGYVSQLNFSFNPTFAKLSLLALYYRIFSVNVIFLYWIWSLAVIQVCWFIAMVLCRAMVCLPLEALWDTTVPGRCLNVPVLLASDWSVNAALAFAMTALGIFMVRTLSMSGNSKWKLGVLFILGGLRYRYNRVDPSLWEYLQSDIFMGCDCPYACQLNLLLRARASDYLSQNSDNHENDI